MILIILFATLILAFAPWSGYIPVAINILLLLPLLTPRLSPRLPLDRQRRAPLFLLALLTGWYVLSLIWSEARPATLASLGSISLILFAAVTATGLSRERWSLLQNGVVLSGLTLFAIALYQHFLEGAVRPSSLMMSPNNLGGYLNLVLLPVFAALLAANDKRKAFRYGVFTALLIAAVMLTQSRGAIVALLITASLLYLLGKPWRRQPTGIVASWIITGVAIGALLAGSSLGDRFAPMLKDSEPSITAMDASTGDYPRLGIWQSALTMGEEHPWLGWGGGTFMQAYPAYRPDGYSPVIYNAHNDYLQLLVELGPFGVILLLALVGSVLLLGVRYARGNGHADGHRAGLSAGLWALFIQILFTSSLYATPIGLLAGIYLGRLTARPDSAPDIALDKKTTILFKGGVAFILLNYLSLISAQFYIDRAINETVPVKRYKLLETAAKLNPSSDVPHYLTAQLVYTMLQKGEVSAGEVLDQALTQLDKAQKLMPLRRQTYQLRAKLLTFRDPLPTALIVQNYTRLLMLNPKHLQARLEYTDFLEAQGRGHDACRILNDGYAGNHYYTRRSYLISLVQGLMSCRKRGLLEHSDVTSLEQLQLQRRNLEASKYDLIYYRFPMRAG